VTTEGNPDFLDPGFAYAPESWQILANTGDGLLAFRRASGRAGAAVVPDIAVAMPAVTDGGRTLTFFVRRGVRFSPPINREVQASDVKATLERLFVADSRGAPLYANIVGAEALARTRRGGLSGVSADDASGRLVIHLVRPDPAFLDALSLPFAFVMPRETPPVDQSAKPPVATGPYYVKSYQPNREIDLERNPNFQQWSPDIPNGDVDHIIVKIGVRSSDAMGQLATGKADYTQSRLRLRDLGRLPAARKIQVHREIELATYYYFMNVTTPPFNDVRVRRAVNYAINRSHIATLFAGEAITTAQALPPAIPGYRRQNPYPGPDVARARALIQRAGVQGARVTVWGYNTEPSPAVTTYLVDVLNRIGLKARARFMDKDAMLKAISERRTRAQIGYARWQPDFPDAVDVLDLLLNGSSLHADGNLNYSYLDDAGLDRQMERARTVANPTARAAAWAAVENAMLRDAPWAPFVNSVRTDVTSARVRGYVYHPVYGFLWMSAWLTR
jgi:peptide/nickel transport system substrate-binding protein